MRKMSATVFTAMLFELLVCSVVFAPGQADAQIVIKNPSLHWHWPYSTNNIVFNIYTQTNLALPHSMWPIIGTTAGTQFAITENLPAQFFFVCASNTATGMVSPLP
jgi:hypothetical protein